MILLGCGLAAGLLIGITGAVLYYRKVVEHVRETETRLREAERLAHLGRLAGGLAHEIKNPLSTLSINLQLLEEDLRSDGEGSTQRYGGRLEVLRREVRRLEEVLEDFLRYARPHQLELELQNVNDVIREIIDFITPEATRAGIRMSAGLADDLKPTMLDAGRLKQAFLNIIINAKQAMPDGGEIIIRSANVDGGVRIGFIDTGVGISRDDLDRIWDIYYSSKKTGTGLGLPTARRIVEEHGGSVTVHSDVGKGTCFTVFLPEKE